MSKGLGWISEPRAFLCRGQCHGAPAAKGEPTEALAEVWGTSQEADGDLLAPAAPRVVLGLGLTRLWPLHPVEGVCSMVNLSLHRVFLGQCVFLGRGLTLCFHRR